MISVHDGGGRAGLGMLDGFRRQLHGALTARRDGLFEVCDALLCAEGPVATLVGLSLAGVHQRGHGGLYDALNNGRIDVQRLRVSVAAQPIPRVDGRIVLASDVLKDLAEVTGWSPSTVARRIEQLCATGALFFDVQVDDALLGVTTAALLWMSVPPAGLDRVATTLAAHPELAVVAATTGPTNLLATALCPDAEALHHYLAHRLARTPVTHLETAPVLRTLKAVAPVTS